MYFFQAQDLFPDLGFDGIACFSFRLQIPVSNGSLLILYLHISKETGTSEFDTKQGNSPKATCFIYNQQTRYKHLMPNVTSLPKVGPF